MSVDHFQDGWVIFSAVQLFSEQMDIFLAVEPFSGLISCQLTILPPPSVNPRLINISCNQPYHAYHTYHTYQVSLAGPPKPACTGCHALPFYIRHGGLWPGQPWCQGDTWDTWPAGHNQAVTNITSVSPPTYWAIYAFKLRPFCCCWKVPFSSKYTFQG